MKSKCVIEGKYEQRKCRLCLSTEMWVEGNSVAQFEMVLDEYLCLFEMVIQRSVTTVSIILNLKGKK